MADLIEQLAGIDVDITDDDIAMTLLASLPKSYEALIVMLGSRSDELTSEFVKSQLLQEEARQNEGMPLNDNAALLSKKGQKSFKKNEKKSDKKLNDKSIKCFHCGKPGCKD